VWLLANGSPTTSVVDGQVWHFDGSTWTHAFDPPFKQWVIRGGITGTSGRTSGSGRVRTVARYDGSNWSTFDLTGMLSVAGVGSFALEGPDTPWLAVVLQGSSKR
jgi:hypothetical protein